MKTSESGIQLLKQFEGLELEAYQDIADIWTIGYGHTGPDVQPGTRISEREAEELLRRDLKSREQAVESATKVKLNQNEFDALVSFVYNVGAGALRSSTALKRLNKGDRVGAADALTWWNKATVSGVLRPVLGLTRRRAAERALFLTPTSPVQVRDPKQLDENTRVTPIEDSPRRGNVAESRTVQGATIAGGAGVASSSMGREDAEELNNIETNIENGTGYTDVPNSMGDGSAPATGNLGTPQPDASTHDEFGHEQMDNDLDGATGDQTQGQTTETVGIPSDERPSKHEVHAVEAQIQFALLVLIVLAVLYVIYARFDDWNNYRR